MYAGSKTRPTHDAHFGFQIPPLFVYHGIQDFIGVTPWVNTQLKIQCTIEYLIIVGGTLTFWHFSQQMAFIMTPQL